MTEIRKINTNCFIVRGLGKGLYHRCDYCDQGIHQCLGMLSNILLFFSIFLLLVLLTAYDSILIKTIGLLILILLLANGILVENKTNELVFGHHKVRENEEELKKAYEKLKAVEELKADIISNVSHELRTPMTISRGMIEVALDEDDPSKRGDILKMALESLDRQNDIVENLVTISRIYAKQFKIDPSPVDIPMAITNVIRRINIKAEKKSIRIDTKLNKDLPIIMTDEEKLRHVLSSLLDNAIKFNKENGWIEIEAGVKDDQLQISITDSGIGIKDEDLEIIFQPLTQLDPSIRRKFGGTGTGLAIVKNIIELLGGKIWAESGGVNQGVTFSLTLPLGEGAQMAT